MKFSKGYIDKIRQKTEPKTLFKTMAEDGLLNEYIEDFFKDKYENDPEFQEKIISLQIEYSNEPVEKINDIYLKEISKALNEFISKVENGRN